MNPAQFLLALARATWEELFGTRKRGMWTPETMRRAAKNALRERRIRGLD